MILSKKNPFLILGTLVIFSLLACGRYPSESLLDGDSQNNWQAEKLIWQTDQLSKEQLEGLGISSYQADLEKEDRLKKGGSYALTFSTRNTAGTIVNAVAEQLIGLIEKGQTISFAPQKVAEAIPSNVDPLNLVNGKSKTENYYRKVLSSISGRKLVEAFYQVSYVYDASYRGHGHYIPSVTFLPLRVEINDVGLSFKAEAMSETPTNINTTDDPVAALKFNAVFTAEGIVGATQGTDIYFVEGKYGSLSNTQLNNGE